MADGALGLLKDASLKLVTNLDLDIEEIILDMDEFYLDRAFVELKELERDLNSQRSFYLAHVETILVHSLFIIGALDNIHPMVYLYVRCRKNTMP